MTYLLIGQSNLFSYYSIKRDLHQLKFSQVISLIV